MAKGRELCLVYMQRFEAALIVGCVRQESIRRGIQPHTQRTGSRHGEDRMVSRSVRCEMVSTWWLSSKEIRRSSASVGIGPSGCLALHVMRPTVGCTTKTLMMVCKQASSDRGQSSRRVCEHVKKQPTEYSIS